jgi:peroxiredoxin/predicted 2-oxoglutarate/Fe(II)-dependent dioxygenase YbiX
MPLLREVTGVGSNSPLGVGEPAPWFSAAASRNPLESVAFDELAGRYIVLFFFGSAGQPEVAKVFDALALRKDLFGDEHAVFLGISSDPNDFERERVRRRQSGQLFLWDANGSAALKYGVAQTASAAVPGQIRPTAFVVSPALQIVEILQMAEPTAFVGRMTSLLSGLLASQTDEQNAPVLVVPQVFDRAFCDQLIERYRSEGGREIGVIEQKGKIVERFDPKFRKRFDWYISDDTTIQVTRDLLQRRLLPMVHRAFQFRTTRIERYLVGCYDTTTGGHFQPHRDNTAPIVAHRRFAVTINLNDGYEGGHLRFPEFSRKIYRAAPGDAIVFSCSLLHEVTQMARGERFAFLSFIYDEEGQRLRDEYSRRTAAAKAS